MSSFAAGPLSRPIAARPFQSTRYDGRLPLWQEWGGKGDIRECGMKCLHPSAHGVKPLSSYERIGTP